MQVFLDTVLRALIVTPIVLLAFTFLDAHGMQSTNYRIDSDSVNFGGGFSTSTSYRLESTGGEVATGESASASYRLKAGYQQMQEVYIALSGLVGVTLSPSLPGITGGVANASTTALVTTDSPSGYSLTIVQNTQPALQKGVDSLADYLPVGSVPDFTFVTDAGEAHFGYSAEGVDITSHFKDNGSVCGTGSLDTSLACWERPSTTPRSIALRQTPNHPSGSTTTVRFRVGLTPPLSVPSGIYTGTTTITALPL
jgi:hypothetical protein